MLAMRTLLMALPIAILITPTWASEALAQKKNCLTCHAISKRGNVPAYRDIAAKYSGQVTPELVTRLARKVMKGGAGVWGVIPMPANPQVTQAEAETLVRWVLTQK